jgi:hypothetical protein
VVLSKKNGTMLKRCRKSDWITGQIGWERGIKNSIKGNSLCVRDKLSGKRLAISYRNYSKREDDLEIWCRQLPRKTGKAPDHLVGRFPYE